MLTLDPGKTTLATLEKVWRGTTSVSISREAKPAIDRAVECVASVAASDKPIYGVNTGFGKLASVRIPSDQTLQLHRNLVLSHCCGVGEPLDAPTTRLMLALKILSLGRGASGVRWEVVTLLEQMLNRNVLPIIPSQGSVGASGDLAPLAHVAAVLMGEGEAIFENRRLPGRDALQSAGLVPIQLGPKEGLGLINGTQFSTAAALVGCFRAADNVRNSIVTSCLSTDAAMGSDEPLHPDIHSLRGHLGQIDIASAMRSLMEKSEIRDSHRDGDTRVQDPYCIRCQPQVAGAALGLLRFAARTLETEANAVSDNPLVLTKTGEIVSGGNFHAEPVAFAADQIALAIAEIGSIAQRRISLLVDPALNHDLPPFLTRHPGLNSGLMIAEVTTAALMSENKHLANACSIDSTPTSANQEDHVSMAAHAARRLERMNRNLNVILGVEAIAAVQGIELRSPLRTSPILQRVVSELRREIPPLDEDRYLADDIACASDLIASRRLIEFAGIRELLAP